MTFNTPFTQGLRPFCLPCATIKLVRSSLEAQRRQNGRLGRSMVAHRMLKHRNGRHGRCEVFDMFKTVAQRSPSRMVAERSLTGGRAEAQGSPGLQKGRTIVGQWLAYTKCVMLEKIVPDIGDASASLVRPLCLLWPTNSVHWAMTVATTVPPFGDHGNPWASIATILPPSCLLWATCCASSACL